MLKFNHYTPVELPEIASETNEDGKRYYILDDGTRLPSVTTILSARYNHALEIWKKNVGPIEANRISKLATGRGTNFHTIVENHLKNDKFPLRKSMPDAMEMFFSVKPLLARINNIHCQEQTLFSRTIGMAGRTDAIAEYDEELASIDFKTSKRIKLKEEIDSYFIQTTAYGLMYEEMTGIPVKKLVIIMAVEHEKPLLFVDYTKNYIPKLHEAIKHYHATMETA
jgi:hypothetical protein